VVVVDFEGGPSFRIKIIVLTPPTKLILCMYVVREIVLHTRIMHHESNCGSKAFAKKSVAPNG
jgi:hypothetical protein